MEECQKYREKKRERRIRDRLRMIGRARRVARLGIYYQPDNPVEDRNWRWGWRDLDNHFHKRLDTWEDIFLARESWARRCCDNLRMRSRRRSKVWRHYRGWTLQEVKAEEDAAGQFREAGINYKGMKLGGKYF